MKNKYSRWLTSWMVVIGIFLGIVFGMSFDHFFDLPANSQANSRWQYDCYLQSPNYDPAVLSSELSEFYGNDGWELATTSVYGGAGGGIALFCFKKSF